MNEDINDISDAEAESFLKERFLSLPKVVQDAITSADIAKHLRDLAQTHQLHVDQWEVLENQVQLTLLGIRPIADLEKNIAEALHLSHESAAPLAADVIAGVFEPIRQELERRLDNPEAQAVAQTAVEAAGAQTLAAAEPAPVPATTDTSAAPIPTAPADAAASSAAPQVATPTPAVPTPAPTVERGAIAPSYQASAPSHERRTIEGDPYREQIA